MKDDKNQKIEHISNDDAYKKMLEKPPHAVKLSMEYEEENEIESTMRIPPEIKIYCKSCASIVPHRGKKCSIDYWDGDGKWKKGIDLKSHHSSLLFICRACDACVFMYFDCFDENDEDGEPQNNRYIEKVGQYPSNIDVPKHIMEYLQSDTEKDFYIKALLEEQEGRGIGAMMYWRRIVEKLREHLIGDIILILEEDKEENDEIIQDLHKQKVNWCFEQSIDNIKLPASWMIRGENPLLLIHNKISAGVHKLDEWECIERAESIRIIIDHIIEKIYQTRISKENLETAVKNLKKQ